MDNALSQGQIKQKVFGASFAPGKLELHFGGMNAQLYSNPIEFYKVIRHSDDNGKVFPYWILGNGRVYVGDSKRPVLNGLQTIISTDSLYTRGPRDQVHKFYKNIPGSYEAEGSEGLYEFPCTGTPKVKLSWDKMQWEHLG